MGEYNAIVVLEKDNKDTYSILLSLNSESIDAYFEEDIYKLNSLMENNIDCILINVDSYEKQIIEDLYRYIKSKDIVDKNRVPLICYTNNVEISDELEEEYLNICDDFIANPFKRILVFKKKLRTQLENMSYIREIQKLSLFDPLTEVGNRRYLDIISKRYFELSRRQNIPLFTLMIDIDNFKHFNDTYGHSVGDIVLKFVTSCIKKIFKRSSDMTFRFGGDEFIIIGLAKDNVDYSELAVELRKMVEIDSAKLNFSVITISIGYYQDIPKANETFLDIKTKSDKALYKAKEFGRNKVVRV